VLKSNWTGLDWARKRKTLLTLPHAAGIDPGKLPVACCLVAVSGAAHGVSTVQVKGQNLLMVRDEKFALARSLPGRREANYKG
jgi:hypothetical protein